MATGGPSSAVGLITDSAFSLWKPLMGEKVLKLLCWKVLKQKNETISSILLQRINIRLQKKIVNLGKMNPKQQAIRRAQTWLHNSPELLVMRSLRQLPHSSKEWGGMYMHVWAYFMGWVQVPIMANFSLVCSLRFMKCDYKKPIAIHPQGPTVRRLIIGAQYTDAE